MFEPTEPAAPLGDGGLCRVRLDIAYDGTDFAGWATQPGLRTVQGSLEEALEVVTRSPCRLTVAGRTDSGVHALGQVAHVDLPSRFVDVVQARVNGRLDRLRAYDLRVRGAGLAAPGFDARFSALWRRYVYRVRDGVADPLRRHDTLRWVRPLSVDRMAEAATLLLGERDFASYCKQREGATTIRTLQRLDVARSEGVVELHVQADAFCHSMVRALTGALLSVGDGRKPVEWPAQVLAAELRDPGVTVAPAHGLTLVEVCYPSDDLLLERQSTTRAMRGPGFVA
jgi:tRNA pseudouridine38-40 synthase